MKRIIAILLVFASFATLSACSLIRKADAEPNAHIETEKPEDQDSYATGFSDTVPEEEPKTPVRYSEEQAYELLSHSFPDYDMELVKIERTGEIVAEDDGTEYYIFNVALPKKPAETEKPADTSGEAESESETKPVEMEPAVPYYVSVNGVVHKELAGKNVDTKYAKDTFAKKYGDKNSETGFAYKLVYEGIVEGNGKLCYSFAVYEVNTSGAEPKNTYLFNYLVTIDGAYNAKTNIEH